MAICHSGMGERPRAGLPPYRRLYSPAACLICCIQQQASPSLHDPIWRSVGPNGYATDFCQWNPALRVLLLDLWQAYHGVGADDPVPPPPPVDASTGTARAQELQAADALVLGSPRASREVLRRLAEDARHGELRTGEHTATVAAADDLYTALVASRTLRIRRT